MTTKKKPPKSTIAKPPKPLSVRISRKETENLLYKLEELAANIDVALQAIDRDKVGSPVLTLSEDVLQALRYIVEDVTSEDRNEPGVKLIHEKLSAAWDAKETSQ